jgi:DNA modification methylase
MLAVEVADLRDMAFETQLIGFSAIELADLFIKTQAGLTDPDAVPEPQAVAVSRPGDVWRLGRHRLICGDCTVPEVVSTVLNGVAPHLMVTDPPYGVAYDPTWRHRAGVNKSKRTGKVTNDDRADWRAAWILFPGEVAYVWHGALHAAEVADSLEACGFQIRTQIVWAKERFVLGRGDYHWQHEPCWYAVRGTGHWAGDRKQTTLWQIANRDQDADTVHGTQKPVECMKRPIENNSSPGQAVYEPFSGSGTTIIASEITGGACYAVELDPIYVDVAVRRWQAFTGEAVVLEADQRDFSDVANARRQSASDPSIN